MLRIESKIKDRNFTNIIRKFTESGYFCSKRPSANIAGVLRSNSLALILVNIYLRELDLHVMKMKENYDETCKSLNKPEFNPSSKQIARFEYLNRRSEIPGLRKVKRSLNKNSRIYLKSLFYVRYGDNVLIGVKGQLKDCRFVKFDI